MVSLDFPSYISVSGWDWMPAIRDRVAGIWNHVRLRSTGPAVLGDPRVDTSLPNLPDTGLADVTIVVPVRNAGSGAATVTVGAAFGAVQVSTTVTVPGGGDTEVTFSPADFPALAVKNPRLWWPNGYGDPDLYDLVLTATVDGAESDRRVQCGRRATQYGDSMWTLSVFNTASPGTDLALHKTATASSVDDPSRGPENAVDGNLGTRWSSAYEDNQWIEVDLGSVVAFDQVEIVWEQAYALNYVIQVSDDGATWTDVKSGQQRRCVPRRGQRRARLLPGRQLGLGRTAPPHAPRSHGRRPEHAPGHELSP
jgi:hypothetical protein